MGIAGKHEGLCSGGAQGGLGSRFPGCLEEIMLGRVREAMDEQKRDTAVIRTIMKKVLVALKRLHSLGARPQQPHPLPPIDLASHACVHALLR